MDFIIDLLLSNVTGCIYDAVLVIVNRFTKLARYLSLRKDLTTEGLAEVFLIEVVCWFSISTGIIFSS